jgi:hypothetical protein
MAFILVPSAAVAPALTLPEAAFVYVRADRPERVANVNIREQGRQIAPGMARAVALPIDKWTLRSRAIFIVAAAVTCWVPPVLLVLRLT